MAGVMDLPRSRHRPAPATRREPAGPRLSADRVLPADPGLPG